jgi:hypothetical protein
MSLIALDVTGNLVGAGLFTLSFEGPRPPYKSSRMPTYIAAQATFAKTQTAHIPNTIPKLAPGLIFFEFAAAKPIATSTRQQIQNNSSELPNANNVFGAVSGKYAFRLVARTFSGSTSP